ncbi:MAG TPA: hypothetical protein VFD43_12600 [Planctomycetota bacterium]|nr:hypothetical protein [Planctomycetota bacterium]
METGGQIGEGQRAQLELAAALHRPLARAAQLGRSNAWGYAIFGVLTLLLAALGPDPLALAVGAVVTGVGVAQLRAARRLRAADPRAPRAMARNELLLMGAIGLYALLKLTLLAETGEALRSSGVDATGLGLDIEELARSLNTLVYSGVLAVTLLYQGGLALYFLRRRATLERYLAEAPEWARTTVESLGE